MITDVLTEQAAAAPPKPKSPRQIDPGNDYLLGLYLRDLAEGPLADDAGPLPVTVSLNYEPHPQTRLVLTHLPNVIRIAFDYQGYGLPLGDLIGEGNLGLLRAAELFDPLRNVKFSYYAQPWIRVQMQRALSYQAWPVSLPADFRWSHARVWGAEERLTARLNRAPADAEIADESGLDVPAVRRLRSAPLPSFIPLDSPSSEEEPSLTLAEMIPDNESPSPDEQSARHSDCEFLQRLLAILTANEQRVLRLRYGLDDGCERTLDEVGRLLGYCRQGIHRIESAALTKLRQHARLLQLAVRPGHFSSPSYSFSFSFS